MNFVPVLFGVNAGVELPAGTLATTSEDRILAVHHTSPASLMARVCLCSLSLRQLPVYSYSFTQLHHMIHNNCCFFQEYTSIRTHLPCFCKLKMNSISVKGKIILLNIRKNAFLQKQQPIRNPLLYYKVWNPIKPACWERMMENSSCEPKSHPLAHMQKVDYDSYYSFVSD